MAKKVIIGKFRYPITLQQITRTQDTETGAWNETISTARETRALREFVSSGSDEDIEDDLQLIGVQKRFYTIWKLDSSFNVSDFRISDNGVILDIIEILPSGYGERYLKLVCVERNNDNS